MAPKKPAPVKPAVARTKKRPAAKPTPRARRQQRRPKIGYALMVICGVISIYVFAASFETTFNRDLPVVNAVSTVYDKPLDRLIQASYPINQGDFGNYGKPGTLKVPTNNSRVVLAPLIKDGNKLVARANTAHFALLSAPKNGNLGNLMVYFISSWRTDPNANKLKAGDNIFIDTDRDWRYFYRIDTVQEVTENTYIARESVAAQLTLVAQSQPGKLTVIEASLVNVQNVRQ